MTGGAVGRWVGLAGGVALASGAASRGESGETVVAGQRVCLERVAGLQET